VNSIFPRCTGNRLSLGKGGGGGVVESAEESVGCRGTPGQGGAQRVPFLRAFGGGAGEG